MMSKTEVTSAGASLLVRRVCSAYPQQTAAWQTGDLGVQWASELRRAKTTDHDAHAALDAYLARGGEFPPSLPVILGPAAQAARRRRADERERARLAELRARDVALLDEVRRGGPRVVD